MGLPVDPRGRELAQLVARDAYERWLAAEVETLLTSGLKDVATTLLTSKHFSSGAQQRLSRLFGQINDQLTGSYTSARDFLQQEMHGCAGVESDAATGFLDALVSESDTTEVALGTLTAGEVRAIAELPIAGLDIGTWFEKQANDMSLFTRRQIQIGLLEGQSSSQIANRIIGAETDGAPTVLGMSRRAANTLVRTTVTTVSNHAALASYRAAGDRVTDSWRFTAVRDSRTSAICRSLDGQVFRYDDAKAPVPPRHPNCRSTAVPIVNYGKLGIPTRTTTAPSWPSYSQWLDQQTPAVQDSILGVGRGAMYRKGGVSLADMVASDTRTLTLKELRATYDT